MTALLGKFKATFRNGFLAGIFMAAALSFGSSNGGSSAIETGDLRLRLKSDLERAQTLRPEYAADDRLVAFVDSAYDDLNEAIRRLKQEPVNHDLLQGIVRLGSRLNELDPSLYAGELLLPVSQRYRRDFGQIARSLSRREQALLREAFAAIRESKKSDRS